MAPPSPDRPWPTGTPNPFPAGTSRFATYRNAFDSLVHPRPNEVSAAPWGFATTTQAALPETQAPVTDTQPRADDGQGALQLYNNEQNNQMQQLPVPLVPVTGNTFMPMDAAVAGGSRALVLRNEDAVEKIRAGFSQNYRGDISVERNRSANIPDDMNCAVFITGLPPTIDVASLLGASRNTGRVFATVINTPMADAYRPTCAAKVVFFDRVGAERFYHQHGPGMRIPGYPNYVGRVVWNRVRSAPFEGPSYHSRVLVITGPLQFVNPDSLTVYFRSKFIFDIDGIFDRGMTQDGRRIVEYRFGSYRCQAESAKMALSREWVANGVEVKFGRDPCDV